MRITFSAESCAILQALRKSRQHQQVYHFSSFFLSYFLFVLARKHGENVQCRENCIESVEKTDIYFLFQLLSFLFHFLWCIRQELSSLSSSFFIRPDWVPGRSSFSVNCMSDELTTQGEPLHPSMVYVVYFLLPLIPTHLFLLTGDLQSHQNFATHSSLPTTEPIFFITFAVSTHFCCNSLLLKSL